MSYQTLESGRFFWRFKLLGHGERLLVAFHGFNRDPDDLIPFAKELGSQYTIAAFELLYHGKSHLKGADPLPFFTREELKEALLLLMDRLGKDTFDVMGHSFGGRLALNCVEIFGDRLRGLYLLAPDAMRFNPGFWFATQTLMGRWLLGYFKDHPTPVIRLMRMLSNLRLYSQKAMDFYISQITWPPMKGKVHHVWMAHRATTINRRKVAEIIGKYRIPTVVFLGKYDSIISNPAAERFVATCGPSAEVHWVESGHRLYEKHEDVCGRILL